MSVVIYDFAVSGFRFFAKVHSMFNEKTSLFIKGRKGVMSELKRKFEGNTSDVIWFHCSSLGEFEMSVPLIEKIKKEDETCKILVTFFSPSGYEVRKGYKGVFHISYLPFDSKNNAKIFFDIVQPKRVYFAKYDLWYHYLNECNKRNVSLCLFNAHFNNGQIFFKWYGGLFREMLGFFNQIYVLNDNSKKLLNAIEVDCEVVGDTRFDKVYNTVKNVKKFPEIKQFKGNEKLLIIGSSWKQDLDVISSFLASDLKGVKIVVAPHEIGENNLKDIEGRWGDNTIIRYSKLSNNFDKKVLIIDNVGMLSSIYYYGDFGYIGGAFKTGLHNILEAATFGMPLFFGPKYEKFPEAIELVSKGGAVSIKNENEFKEAFELVCKDDELRETKSSICRQFVLDNIGSANKILNKK